ncbi:MAG: RNA polymerase sigma factor [Bacteriovoracaceae bacterium]|jgi:RNA polymerase sigma factor (sigma-70 family)|nr:RNA polymerase sigma factor [Bacteriovoracaceae bacterium]
MLISDNHSLVYEVYSKELYRHLYFLTGNKELSEDLLQNTFIRVFQKLDQLKDSHKLRSWIYQIARNLYFDHLKSGYESTKDILDDDVPSLDSSSKAQAESVHDLNFILNQLSPDDREIILLVEMEGMTVSEVSDITRDSSAAIKSRLLRARKKIISIKNESF